MEALSDFEIYRRAKKSGNIIIISKDSDIEDIINTSGSPPKLINIEIGNCTNRFLYSILKKQIEKLLRLLTDFGRDVVH